MFTQRTVRDCVTVYFCLIPTQVIFVLWNRKGKLRCSSPVTPPYFHSSLSQTFCKSQSSFSLTTLKYCYHRHKSPTVAIMNKAQRCLASSESSQKLKLENICSMSMPQVEVAWGPSTLSRNSVALWKCTPWTLISQNALCLSVCTKVNHVSANKGSRQNSMYCLCDQLSGLWGRGFCAARRSGWSVLGFLLLFKASDSVKSNKLKGHCWVAFW